jgi:predicted DCC family thiol-disulfide oxidoreductase YuxK
MTENATVIYNHTCPICRREIDAYRRTAEAQDLPLEFKGIDSDALSDWGLTVEDAARRLHVVEDGRLLSGVDAFVALWKRLPRMRWLARLVERPWIRPVAETIYERALAPILYAMHRARVRRQA